MGCSPGDQYCGDNESPPHSVTITKGFWLGQTEVTVGAFRQFADNTSGIEMPGEPTIGDRKLNPGWSDKGQPMGDTFLGIYLALGTANVLTVKKDR